MITFLENLAAMFAEQVIGGTGSLGIYIASVLLCLGLVILLVIARFPPELALMITSPAIVVMSFKGWLPAITLGPTIVLVAMFWTGLILAIAGKNG